MDRFKWSNIKLKPHNLCWLIHFVSSSHFLLAVLCSASGLEQLLGQDLHLLRQLDARAAAGPAGAVADHEQPSSSSVGAADAATGSASLTGAGSKVKLKQEPDSDVEIQDVADPETATTPKQSAGGRSKTKQSPQQQQQLQRRSRQRVRAAAGRRQQQHAENDAEEQSEQQDEVQLDAKPEQQAVLKHEQHQQHEAVSTAFEHSLFSFQAYAECSKEVHFSCQPCNAALMSVLKDLQSSEAPTAKRARIEAKQKLGRQQQQPSGTPEPPKYGEDETETASELPEDTKPIATAAAAAAALAAGFTQNPLPLAAAVVSERHSSRLQQKSVLRAGNRAAAAPKVRASAAKGKPKAGAQRQAAGASPAAAGAAGQAATTIEQVEAEFWRIVEQPDPNRIVEALIAQVDRDTALPAGPQHVARPSALSSLLRSKQNMLRHLDLGRISGVTVPQLCIGSCFSMQCWQQAQHALYNVSYLQSGAQQVSVRLFCCLSL